MMTSDTGELQVPEMLRSALAELDDVDLMLLQEVSRGLFNSAADAAVEEEDAADAVFARRFAAVQGGMAALFQEESYRRGRLFEAYWSDDEDDADRGGVT